MRYEDIIKDAMSIFQGLVIPRADAYICSFLDRKILEIEIKLESVQEERDTPLVESYNQQQIYIWVRTKLSLPSVRGQTYKEWEPRQSCERIILDKSSYSDVLVKYGVPKSTLTYSPKVISPPMKKLFSEAPLRSHMCWQNNK